MHGPDDCSGPCCQESRTAPWPRPADHFAAWIQQARRLEGDHDLDLPLRSVAAAACNAADRAYAGLPPAEVGPSGAAEIARLRTGLATIRADHPAVAQMVDAILWPAPAQETKEGASRQ